MSDDALLDGYTILDLTEGAAGPFCTKLFADYGARVIKVERPGRGDPARRAGPYPPGPNPDAGALFLALNTGKESITLDYATATGRRLLLELVEHADVVIDSAPPGHLDALGLGVDMMEHRNPRILTTSVTAFGGDGPYAAYRASELTAFAAGGQHSITGDPDREPVAIAGHQASYQAGLHAFGATLAGLFSVGIIEVGQHMDISAMECMASTIELYLPDYAYFKREILTKRRGNIVSAIIGVFPCADGHVGVHVMPRNFPSLARTMDDESMLTDERFATNRARLANNDELLARIYAWTAAHTRAELYQRSGEERSGIAPVFTIPEVLEQPHLRERGAIRELDDPRGVTLTYPGPPFRSAEGEWELRPAPRLGEHNAAVYEELLELSGADLARLRAAGVV
jgi:crotonobetainyl-CoA:carnitine CoA-transferase CaiB-like acyl-CoA transferase